MFFFKNFLYTFEAIIFTFFSLYSGVFYFDEFYDSMFNTFVSIIPLIIFFIIDEDFKPYFLKKDFNRNDIKRKLDKILSDLDSNLNIIIEKIINHKGKEIKYFDEFFLYDKKILELMIMLGFNKKEIKKVECCKINKKEIYIFDAINEIILIGDLDNENMFNSSFLIEKSNKEKDIIKDIKDKEGIQRFIKKSENCKKKDNYYRLSILNKKNEEEMIYIYDLFGGREKNKKDDRNKTYNDNYIYDLLLYNFQNGLNILLSIISSWKNLINCFISLKEKLLFVILKSFKLIQLNNTSLHSSLNLGLSSKNILLVKNLLFLIITSTIFSFKTVFFIL
jgi:hypothetical protein